MWALSGELKGLIILNYFSFFSKYFFFILIIFYLLYIPYFIVYQYFDIIPNYCNLWNNLLQGDLNFSKGELFHGMIFLNFQNIYYIWWNFQTPLKWKFDIFIQEGYENFKFIKWVYIDINFPKSYKKIIRNFSLI